MHWSIDDSYQKKHAPNSARISQQTIVFLFQATTKILPLLQQIQWYRYTLNPKPYNTAKDIFFDPQEHMMVILIPQTEHSSQSKLFCASLWQSKTIHTYRVGLHKKVAQIHTSATI
jgi:hypothetical protein